MKRKNLTILLVVSVTLFATAGTALAMVMPVAGDLFYEVYAFAASLTTGAPAATVGLGGVAAAAFFLLKQQVLPAAGCAVGSIVLINAVPIVSKFGFIV